MSQNDFTIANQSFPAFRADLNSALQALASNSSGGSAPSTTFANMWWYDTSNNILYIRNEDNDAWIQFATLDQANDLFVVTSSIDVGDNVKALFGDSDDLQIYHNGSASYIDDVGTGNLFIRANDFRLGKYTGEFYLKGNSDGNVELYYDNELKLATTSTGIDVTGNITFGDSHTIGDDGSDNLEIATSVGENLILKSSGNVNTYLDTNEDQSTAAFQIFGDVTAPRSLLRVEETGDISFYEDTGSTPKFFWSASAESLGIGVQPETWYPTNPAIQIGLQGVIHATQTGYLQVANNVYRDTDANFKRINTGEASRINFNPDSSIFFSQASSDSADTTISWTNVGTFDTSGNFLVGTTDSSVWDSNADSTADNGGNIRNDGRAGFSYYNASGTNATLNINRTGSDGILAEFRRTGSAVGSIGNTGTTLKINGVNSGFYVGGTNAVIYPQTDNTHNLGTPTLRFEHLYLGGGVYLGGTGSANFLDDYEEGTWTATITTDGTDFTTSGRGTSGYYTKIGNIVIANFSVSINSPTNGTGNLILTGLPFTNTDQFAITSAIAWGRVDLVGSFAPFGQTNGTTIDFYYPVDGATASRVLASHLNGNITPYLSGVVTYKTT